MTRQTLAAAVHLHCDNTAIGLAYCDDSKPISSGDVSDRSIAT